MQSLEIIAPISYEIETINDVTELGGEALQDGYVPQQQVLIRDEGCSTSHSYQARTRAGLHFFHG